MSCINYNNLWESEFYKNVSGKDRVQDVNPNPLKLKVNGSYEKYEKIITKFEAVNDEDVTKQSSSRYEKIKK